MKPWNLLLTTGVLSAVAASAAYAATDATTIIRPIDMRAGTYQVEVVNTSGIGYINSFDWVPPAELKVIAVTGTKGGTCHLANNVISCTGGKNKRGLVGLGICLTQAANLGGTLRHRGVCCILHHIEGAAAGSGKLFLLAKPRLQGGGFEQRRRAVGGTGRLPSRAAH